MQGIRHGGWRGDWRVVILAASAWLIAGAAAAQDPVSRLIETRGAQIEHGMPEESFGAWLRGLLPQGAQPVFRTVSCPGGPGRCVSVKVEIVSRARTFRLDFGFEPLRFLGGEIRGWDAGPQPPITSLAELPDRLVAPIRPRPLDCPEGTRPRLRESYAGLYEWCAEPTGRLHGPARSWFSTGRYLMARGRYERGRRTGEWIECSRFERCETRRYP